MYWHMDLDMYWHMDMDMYWHMDMNMYWHMDMDMHTQGMRVKHPQCANLSCLTAPGP
jgi:hypothetical protein